MNPIAATPATSTDPPVGVISTRGSSAAGTGRGWPILILALLGSQVLMCGVLVALATGDRSVVIEPNYYEKAVRWDETARVRDAGLALGWKATLHIAPQPDETGQRRVRCTLVGRSGDAIDGAVISVEAFHHADASRRMTFQLEGAGSGAYVADQPLTRAGVWELRAKAVRGEDTLVFVEKQFVP